MILGIKFSMDGFAFLAGMKIGGVRLLFPLVVGIPAQPPTQEGKVPVQIMEGHEITNKDSVEILAIYLFSGVALWWFNRRKR